MNVEVVIQLLWLSFQVSLYYSAITWVAWSWQQRHAEDAFHFVVALTLSFGIWYLLQERGLSGFLLMVLTVPLTQFVADVGLPFRHADADDKLLLLLVAATSSIVTFDWLTSSQPVNIEGNSTGYRYLSISSAIFLWLLLASYRKSNYLLVLLAGRESNWAFDYWRSNRSAPKWLFFSHLFCWVTIINYPLSTTGILSLTILKDVSLSVLFARVVAFRGPFVLASLCGTFGMFRTLAGFLFVGGIGPIIVDMAAVITCLLWLHHHSIRTIWNAVDARRLDHSPLD